MEGIKVYVYGLLDNEDNISYVGKSSTPKSRLVNHTSSSRLKILDIFYDKEVYWIEKLQKEGYDLLNQKGIKEVEDWNIGDIVEVNRKENRGAQKIYDSKTSKIYDSLKSLIEELNIERSTFKYRIENSDKPNFQDYQRYILL